MAANRRGTRWRRAAAGERPRLKFRQDGNRKAGPWLFQGEPEEATMMHPKEPGGWQDAQAPEKPDDGKRGQQSQAGGEKPQQAGQKRGQQAGQKRG